MEFLVKRVSRRTLACQKLNENQDIYNKKAKTNADKNYK